MVRYHSIALLGVGFIITSLLIALNASRISIQTDNKFYEYILNIEKPMVRFSRKFTQFSRGEIEEKDLLESYKFVQKLYTENSKKDQEEKSDNCIKYSINLSFYMLIIGIILCFISAVDFCYF